MVMVFFLAIAAAYAGKLKTTVLLPDSEQFITSECQPAETGCNNTGSQNCGVTAYQIPGGGEQHCNILLTKRN